jgi:valyl-tRNA synthetase
MSSEFKTELKTETEIEIETGSSTETGGSPSAWVLSERYQPQEVEKRTYEWWESQGCFKAQEVSTKPPFSIILPPPNVTGFLHIGHALDQSIQDCLIRWKRMSGYNTLWMPGTDHAGIATQSVVEKELQKKGLTRHDLGRKNFLTQVWDWKHEYGDRIYHQMRRLGNSLDWSRAAFTLDPEVSEAVRKVFVSLYKKDLIYRGQRLVNWSGPLETAISDLEVEHKEVKGHLWHIRYPLVHGSEALIVATTRPETLLGDTAVCVNPHDQRYSHLIGQKVKLPLTGREIPIIGDDYVDSSFGSGVVKITPAHDFNDYKIGKKHQLEFINILDKKCYLNENAGSYCGLTVTQARKKILADLKAQDLFEKEEPHIHSVGHCSRSGAVVEPYLSEQWFVKMDQLVTPAKRVIESGTTEIDPDSWTKVYLHWLNIIEDWCISRQLWWGHQIPAWYCQDCHHVTVSELSPTQCEACQSFNIKQDEDVLDTWFSSALWPFSTLGWPKKTELLKTFYPTSVLVTGHDILFFWVARMMIMGLEFMKDVPFRKVFLHGLVRDNQGRKMSKSLGNSVDPVEMIEKYGADSLRFTFLAHIHSGKDFKFSEERLQGYRNFINKIWNGTRFALSHLSDLKIDNPKNEEFPHSTHMSVFDRWIIYKLKEVEEVVESALDQYRFSDAALALYHFVWYEFCDWYIEFTKSIFQKESGEFKRATQLTMALVLNRILRLLHPFTPFVTEELYQKLPFRKEVCMLDDYPTSRNDKQFIKLGSFESAQEVELVKSVLHAVRNIRGENRISPAKEALVRLEIYDDKTQKILTEYRQVLQSLGRMSALELAEHVPKAKSAVEVVVVSGVTLKVIVPLEGLVDLSEEIKRLEKNLEKIDKSLEVLTKRLLNENFIKNASVEVVEGDKKNLEALKSQKIFLSEALIRLRGEESHS